MASFQEDLANYIRAGARCFWVYTHEELRALTEIEAILQPNGLVGLFYTPVAGLWFLKPHENVFPSDVKIVGMLRELQKGDVTQGHAWLLAVGDAHLVAKELGARAFKEAIIHPIPGAKTPGVIVFLSPKREIPVELERVAHPLPFTLPTVEELTTTLKPLMGKTKATELEEIAESAAGYTQQEAEISVRRATLKHGKEVPLIIQEVWDEKSKYLAARQKVEIRIPKITFDDLGGVHDFKRHFTRRLQLFSPEARKSELQDDGVIFVGLPGVGKTMLIEAMAGELSRFTGRRWKFIDLNLKGLRNPYVGVTEQNLEDLFELLVLHRPCFARLDEITHQTSGHESSGMSDAGLTSGQIGRLLTFLQERPPGIFIAGTTNEPWNMIPHLARRFSMGIWHIPMPDEGGVEEVLNIYLKKFASAIVLSEEHAKLIEYLARRKFSPAEIRQVVLEGCQESYPKAPTLRELYDISTRRIPTWETRKEESHRFLEWAESKARKA